MKISLYETHNIAKTHLPFIFHHDKYTRLNAEFYNWHENIEIIKHISGEGYVLIDSEKYKLSDNNITIINSNSIHAFGTESTVEYDCLIIDNRFFSENGIDSGKISFATNPNTERLSPIYTELGFAIDKFRASPGELDIAKIRAFLLALVIELCEHHRESEERHTNYSTEKIKEVISYIYNNFQTPLSLDEISRQAKMSKYYLCREFKSMTSNTIFEFINVVRCREAKRKIRQGLTVSEAAFSVGFDSLSYFTKKFKEINGKLPSEYKK